MHFGHTRSTAVWRLGYRDNEPNQRAWHHFAERWADLMETLIANNNGQLHSGIVIASWNQLTGRHVTQVNMFSPHTDRDLLHAASMLACFDWYYGRALWQAMAPPPSNVDLFGQPIGSRPALGPGDALQDFFCTRPS